MAATPVKKKRNPTLKASYKRCNTITVRVKAGRDNPTGYRGVPVMVMTGEEGREADDADEIQTQLVFRVGEILRVNLQTGFDTIHEETPETECSWAMPRGFINDRETYSMIENVSDGWDDGILRMITRRYAPVRNEDYKYYFEHVDSSMLIE